MKMTRRRAVRLVDFHQPASDVIDEAVSCLTEGGILAAPTETRYGLLVRSDRDETLRRLYQMKGRNLNLPTALFVADVGAAARIGEMNPMARLLAEAFLPGPLTLVLKSVCDWSAPRVVDGKVGVRISSASVITRILDRVTFPLSATSANLSGEKDPFVIGDVERSFGDNVDMYIDAGRIDFPVSTVVDCTGISAVVVRPGAVSEEAIKCVTGRTVL
jgi:L-threonylcarbamoyladenylate synthase